MEIENKKRDVYWSQQHYLTTFLQKREGSRVQLGATIFGHESEITVT